MLANDNVSMSVGHLDHVSTVYSPAVHNQDVIKMSDGH